MSKYLSDFDYGCDSCSSCKNSLDPIDININVTCCPADCPEPPVGSEQCCCQQGVFEALNFLLNLEFEGEPVVVDNIELFGFATGGGVNILSTGSIDELTEDYVILNDFPNRVVSLCAIWIIQVPANQVPGGITSEACEANTTNCCCNPGLRDRLLDIPSEQEVRIILNNQDQSPNRTVGAIRLVCNDSVWIQDCVGDDSPPDCTGVFYAIPLCNIAWFEPV